MVTIHFSKLPDRNSKELLLKMCGCNVFDLLVGVLFSRESSEDGLQLVGRDVSVAILVKLLEGLDHKGGGVALELVQNNRALQQKLLEVNHSVTFINIKTFIKQTIIMVGCMVDVRNGTAGLFRPNLLLTNVVGRGRR